MEINYQPVEKNIKTDCYEFEFSFEHGDADSHETFCVTHQGMTQEQLKNYILKSEEISDMIDKSRSKGTSLPRNFEDMASSDGFYIPVELDNYAKMHMSHYYASSGISKIRYFDENGHEFEVTWKNKPSPKP